MEGLNAGEREPGSAPKCAPKEPARWSELLAQASALAAAAQDGLVPLLDQLRLRFLELELLNDELGLQRTTLEGINAALEERMRLSEASLRQKELLLVAQSGQAALGGLIGDITHQWRQPLNALALLLANLQDSFDFGELDAARMGEVVRDGNRLVKKMASTIDDFRNFFAPRKERTAFSVRTQIGETLALLQTAFECAGISIVVEADSDVLLYGYGNECSQVLLNLLSNARQAIEASRTGQGGAQSGSQGGPQSGSQSAVKGRVTIRLRSEDRRGILSVHDDGGGIPEPVFHRLFEPYFTTKATGTGIGLYMSRQIVERSLGGRLDARNVDGGAEFTLSAPLAGPSDPTQATSGASPA